MPERVTPEERLISLAIEKARKVKELISDPNGIDFTEDEKLEMEKVKRPKGEKVTTKIPNREKEGYGLAGQEISIKKEAGSYDNLIRNIEYLLNTGDYKQVKMPKELLEMVVKVSKDAKRIGIPYNYKEILNEAKKRVDIGLRA